jgi:hypothetical protein
MLICCAPSSRVRNAQRSDMRAFLLRDAKGAIHRQPDHDLGDAFPQQPWQGQRSPRLMVWPLAKALGWLVGWFVCWIVGLLP